MMTKPAGGLRPGERLVRCLTGQSVDRVPFGITFCWAPWGATLERWRQETGNPKLDVAREIGADAGFVNPRLQLGLFPAFEVQVLEETERFVVSRDARGITMRNRRDGASIPEFIDYPVKTRADWDRIKDERLRIDDPRRAAAEDWPAFRARLAESGEAVQVGSFPYGVFGTPRDLMGLEALMIAFYDDPELVHDMMNHLTDLWIAVWRRVAAEVKIDHIHIWEDMSGRQGSLISPDMVERFMMPCYDRMAAFAREAGVPLVSVDSDGDCGELVSIMTRHGINFFFPFEVQAGNDILAVRRQYPDLAILGGLDKRALAAGPEAIDREVGKARRMLEKGRYIPAWDHLIPPDVSWANFTYAAAGIRDLCWKGTLSCH
jgi:uroporphyrinogen decarboxylase